MKGVWIALCLLMLTACSGRPIVRTEVVYVRPPEPLLAPCERPEWDGKTYRDLIDHALRLRGALDDCADRVDALRKWAEEPSSTSSSAETP